jgi:1-acyl-sn-glycerol-3-phosphate acyltransferase
MARPVLKPLNLLFPVRFWLVGFLVVIPAALLVICLPGQERRRRAARRAGRLVFQLAGVRFTVRGLHHLPPASIVVANHASYLDGVILTAALPPRFGFVIKHEMATAPLIGWLLARLGSEFVDRGDKKAGHSTASRLIQKARNGACIGVFPEGTFKREPGLRDFHLGAFLTATRTRLPVAPLVIRGSRHILPAHRWWPRRGDIEVEVLAPVAARGRLGDDARDLRRSVRARILQHCGEPDAAHRGEETA